jgi:hypothetical protein
LALRHHTVWSSLGESGGGITAGSGGLTLRDQSLQRKTLLALPPGSTLQALVDKLMLGAGGTGGGGGAVFVADPDTWSPLSVATASDVVRVATRFGDPWE